MNNKATKRLKYNGIEAQRQAILRRLEKSPATVEQLTTDCNAPDPRARIHELRKRGYQIDTHKIDRPNHDGSTNLIGLYALRVKDTHQCELNFEP